MLHLIKTSLISKECKDIYIYMSFEILSTQYAMLPLFATRLARGTPSVKLVGRLLGTRWLKRLWAPKRGSKFYVWQKRGLDWFFFSLNILKGDLNSIFFFRTLKGGGGSIFYIASQWLEKKRGGGGGSKPRSLPTNFTEVVPFTGNA